VGFVQGEVRGYGPEPGVGALARLETGEQVVVVVACDQFPGCAGAGRVEFEQCDCCVAFGVDGGQPEGWAENM